MSNNGITTSSVRNNLDDTHLAVLRKLTDASDRGAISRESANRALGRTDTDPVRTRKYLNWRLKPLLKGGYIEAIHSPSQSDGSRPLVGYRVLSKAKDALKQNNKPLATTDQPANGLDARMPLTPGLALMYRQELAFELFTDPDFTAALQTLKARAEELVADYE